MDWLSRMGRKGFEALLRDIVRDQVDVVLRDRVEPRLTGIEHRLTAIETSRLPAIETRLSSIETRLDLADRLARLEAEFALMKGRSG